MNIFYIIGVVVVVISGRGLFRVAGLTDIPGMMPLDLEVAADVLQTSNISARASEQAQL